MKVKVKESFFILHNSSVLHMKAKAACTMFLLRIVCFF